MLYGFFENKIIPKEHGKLYHKVIMMDNKDNQTVNTNPVNPNQKNIGFCQGAIHGRGGVGALANERPRVPGFFHAILPKALHNLSWKWEMNGKHHVEAPLSSL